jgi:hypothetical protein
MHVGKYTYMESREQEAAGYCTAAQFRKRNNDCIYMHAIHPFVTYLLTAHDHPHRSPRILILPHRASQLASSSAPSGPCMHACMHRCCAIKLPLELQSYKAVHVRFKTS